MDYWDYRLAAMLCTILFGSLIVATFAFFVVRWAIARRVPPVLPTVAGLALIIAMGVLAIHYPHYLGLAYPPQIDQLVEIADSVNDGYLEGVYDCDDMAVAFWEEATARGYQVQIAVGNIDEDITYLHEADHAWCLAWVEDVPLMWEEGWLAIEVTAAHPVFPEDNQRYYKGIFYDNPSDMPP